MKLSSESTQTFLTKANKLYQDGQLLQAKEYYLEVLNIDAVNADALHSLGIIEVQLGNINQALDYLERAITTVPDNAHFHDTLGNILQRLGRFDDAVAQYKLALKLNPKAVETYNNYANCLTKQGQFDQAMQQYVKALHLQPDFTAAHYNLGMLLMKQGKIPEATKQFRNVIKLSPQHLAAHKHLADLYLQQDKLKFAQQHYLAILQASPEQVDVLNNLGVTELKLKNDEAAIQYFTKVLAIDEKHLEARNNLAALYLQYDRYDNAARHYLEVLKLQPDDIEVNYNLAVAQMALGELQQALIHLDTVLHYQPDHLDALVNLGSVYLRLGFTEKATECYSKAYKLDPNNPISTYMLNALTHQACPTSAPPVYVENLFNNYADFYDKQVTQALRYQAPALLLQAILKLKSTNYHVERALDLGCGTGLCGETFKDFTDYLVGIDLAPKMIKVAKAKNIYNELIVGDINSGLKNIHHSFDLILAADTLVYLGDLQEIFQSCARLLNASGLFAFTVETLTELNTQYSLQSTGRFAHNKPYLLELAQKHGFSVAVLDEIVPRYQDNKPVPSYLVILEKKQ